LVIPVLMDDIDKELISLLGTKVGMLMEDHSARALFLASSSMEDQKVVLRGLDQASNEIQALVAAARSIAE